MMKKKALIATAALSAATLALVLTGCQAGLVTSNLSMNEDGSGTKIITCEILGDEAIFPDWSLNDSGELSTVGNNSAYLVVTGDELAAKIKSYSALEDVEVTATTNDAGSTIITLSYSFANIGEYNTKTKTLAKDEADLIQNASFMMAGRDDEGNQLYTLRDYTANTQNSIDNIFESFWNDPTAFDVTGSGQSDISSYGYKSIYAVTAVTVSVGDTSQTTPTYLYSNASSAVGDYTDYPEWTEVTGTFTASSGNGGNGGNGGGLDTATIAWLSALSVVAVVGVALAIVAVVKKKSTPKSDE